MKQQDPILRAEAMAHGLRRRIGAVLFLRGFLMLFSTSAFVAGAAVLVVRSFAGSVSMAVPWGIAAANFAACVLIALIVSCPWVGKDCGMFLAGFSATLSTFSSLNYGVLKMLRGRRYFSAFLYFSMSALSTLIVVLAAS